MRKLYRNYKDIAVFRIVYIKEAHASDGNRPVPYAQDLGLTQAKNYKERCSTAERFIKDGQIKIPAVIDNIDDRVNKAYQAFPGRVFLVDKDGQLAVAGKQGPWGIPPALKEVRPWLEQYRAKLERSDPGTIKQKIAKLTQRIQASQLELEQLREAAGEKPDTETQEKRNNLTLEIKKNEKLVEVLRARLKNLEKDKPNQGPAKQE